MSWQIDLYPFGPGPIRIPGTDWEVPTSFSPTVPIPEWAETPVTDWIDSSVHNPLERLDLPDVAAPSQLTPTGVQGSDPRRARYAELANQDYAAMQATLLDGTDGTRLRAREYEHLGDPADSWPYGQLVVAALDRAIVTGDTDEAKRALKGMDQFLRADGTVNAHPDGAVNVSRLTDDNAWVGLAFVQAFRLTGDQKYIDGARQIFDYLKSHSQPNGELFWSDNKDSLNTCSAGPAAQLGMALQSVTGDTKYGDQAKLWTSFMERMIDPNTGLVGDHIKLTPDGTTRENHPWTYNQGTLIGTYVQMAEQGDPSKLQAAKDLAARTLDHFERDDRLWKEPQAFNAILFRNLLQLDRVAPDPRIRATLERFVARLEEQARQPNGLYAGNGLGAFRKGGVDASAGATLIDQSAITQMHALLAMSPEQLAHVT